MNQKYFVLAITLWLFSTPLISQIKTPVFQFSTGIVTDAEDFNYVSDQLSGKVSIAALFNLNEHVKVGPKIEYFQFYTKDFFPISAYLQSAILKESSQLMVGSRIGYSFGSSELLDGTNWGGVHLGLELAYRFDVNISKKEDSGVFIGFEYLLQEEKYNDYFLMLQKNSLMRHVLSLNAGIQF